MTSPTHHPEPNLDALEQLEAVAQAAAEVPMHHRGAFIHYEQTFHPAAILSLIARLRAAEEEVGRLRAGLYEACLLYNERGLQPPDPADTSRIDRPSEMAPPACVLCHADVNRGTLVCRECATKHDAALRKLAEGAE
jgi:hypothetical protein